MGKSGKEWVTRPKTSWNLIIGVSCSLLCLLLFSPRCGDASPYDAEINALLGENAHLYFEFPRQGDTQLGSYMITHDESDMNVTCDTNFPDLNRRLSCRIIGLSHYHRVFFIIEGVAVSDSGRYICSSSSTNISQEKQLNVVYAPGPASCQRTPVGKRYAILECNATVGSPSGYITCYDQYGTVHVPAISNTEEEIRAHFTFRSRIGFRCCTVKTGYITEYHDCLDYIWSPKTAPKPTQNAVNTREFSRQTSSPDTDEFQNTEINVSVAVTLSVPPPNGGCEQRSTLDMITYCMVYASTLLWIMWS